jgi:hypothetical protein
MINILKRYIRYVDRRLAIAMVVLVTLVAGLDRTWASSAEGKVAKQQAAVDQAVSDLSAFRTRLTEIRSDGVTNASGLLDRVGRLEVLLPKGADDLATTRLIVTVAESSGVTLEQIKLVNASGRAGDVTGIMKGFRFEFATTGSYAASSNFLTTLVTSQQFIATFDKLEITSIAPGETASIYTGDVSMKGELILWTLLEDPIAGVQPDKAPSAPTPTSTLPPTPDTTTGDAEGTTTDVTAPSPNTPAASTPVTSTPRPAAPTTVPPTNP